MSILEQKLILIVDDSADNRALLDMLFKAKGFRTLCASNGEEALSLMQELTYLPDLIFLDAQMPVMDGYQFRQAQSKIKRIQSIPVVVMTGDSSVEMDERMNFPNAVMTKPLGVESLLDGVSLFI